MGFCVRRCLPTSIGVVVRIVVTKRWMELGVETLRPMELVEGTPPRFGCDRRHDTPYGLRSGALLAPGNTSCHGY